MVCAKNGDSGIDESAAFADRNVLWLCARAVLCVGVAERILLCIWLNGGKDMICTKKGKKSLFFLEIKIFYTRRRVFIRDIYDGVIKAIL